MLPKEHPLDDIESLGFQGTTGSDSRIDQVPKVITHVQKTNTPRQNSRTLVDTLFQQSALDSQFKPKCTSPRIELCEMCRIKPVEYQISFSVGQLFTGATTHSPMYDMSLSFCDCAFVLAPLDRLTISEHQQRWQPIYLAGC